METLDQSTGISPQERADDEAILRHVFEGKPLDPAVADRAQQHGRRIMEEIRRVHGVIDDETFQALLDDDEA